MVEEVGKGKGIRLFLLRENRTWFGELDRDWHQRGSNAGRNPKRKDVLKEPWRREMAERSRRAGQSLNIKC